MVIGHNKTIRRLLIATLSLGILVSLCGFDFGTIIQNIGGSSSWASISKQWRQGLGDLSDAAATMGEAQAEIAEALGLKQQAALLRSAAQNLVTQGDSAGGAALQEMGAQSLSVQKAINEKLRQNKRLTAQEEAAIRKGGQVMMAALTKVGANVFILVQASKAAASAGTPGLGDISALPVLAEIPLLLPKALATIPKLFETGNDLYQYSAEKGIALPKPQEMPQFG
jgi:hypothetical protein